MAATKEDMIEGFRDFLDNKNWHYDYEEEREMIRTGVNLDCKFKSTKMFIRFYETGLMVISTIQMDVAEEYRASVCEYLTRANFGMKNGNFEMDMNDGEVRFKLYCNYAGLDALTDEIMEDCIMIPPVMFDRYGDGLSALMFGFSDPVTEIEKAEKSE